MSTTDKTISRNTCVFSRTIEENIRNNSLKRWQQLPLEGKGEDKKLCNAFIKIKINFKKIRRKSIEQGLAFCWIWPYCGPFFWKWSIRCSDECKCPVLKLIIKYHLRKLNDEKLKI